MLKTSVVSNLLCAEPALAAKLDGLMIICEWYALNVLMAMGIILKDKKDIQWKGLPSATLDDIQELKVNFFQYFFTWFSLWDPFFPEPTCT
jgi:hypothetical protein